MTRMRMIIASTIATLLVVGFTAAPASAGFGVPELEGEVTCDDGTSVITWTLTLFGVPASAETSIDSADLSGATTGTVTFSPNPVPGDDSDPTSSTGVTELDGATSGTVTLDVTATYQGFPQQAASADVELAGDCVASTTTSVETPTTEAVAAAAVQQQPAFTG